MINDPHVEYVEPLISHYRFAISSVSSSSHDQLRFQSRAVQLPLTCAVYLTSCNALNLDEFHETGILESFLGCCDSTISDWASWSAWFSTSRSPFLTPRFSPPTPRGAHPCILRKLYGCLGRGRLQGSLIQRKQTFVDRAGVHSTQSSHTNSGWR